MLLLAQLVLSGTTGPAPGSGSPGFGTPAIGFNTCNVNCGNGTFPNAAFVLGTAEAMVKRGFKAAGYHFVNMDDGWAEPPRPDGRQVPVQAKFPSGLPALVEAVQEMGFGFGLCESKRAAMLGLATRSRRWLS